MEKPNTQILDVLNDILGSSYTFCQEDESPEVDNTKDLKDIKRMLDVEQTEYTTHVIAVAIASDADLNHHLTIPAISGEPICDTTHDVVRDIYAVFAADYHVIGDIPVAYVFYMRDAMGWHTEVPLPLSVIKRHMSPRQKRQFDIWKAMYPEEKYQIQFLQVLNVY